MQALSAAGQVLEVAVRAPKDVDVVTFDAARLDYLAFPADQQGVSRQLRVRGERAGPQMADGSG